MAWAALHCLAQHRQDMPPGRRDARGQPFPGSLAGRTLLGPAPAQQDGPWPGGWQDPHAPWGRGWWDPRALWDKARGLSMGSAGAEVTVMLLLCQQVSARSRQRWGRQMKDQDGGEAPLGPGARLFQVMGCSSFLSSGLPGMLRSPPAQCWAGPPHPAGALGSGLHPHHSCQERAPRPSKQGVSMV